MTKGKSSNSFWNADTLTFLLALPLGYCTSAFQVFSVDSAGFTLTDIGILLFIAVAVYRAVTGQRPMLMRVDLLLGLLLAFFALVLASAITPILSGNKNYLLQYVKSTSHFSYMWLFAVVCACTTVNLESIMRVLRIYVYMAIPVNLFGIYQVPARAFEWPLAWIQYYNMSIKSTEQISIGYEGFFRATSVFSEPSALASFSILTAIILLVPYLMFNVRIVKSRVVFYLCLYSTFVAMFLTFSLTIVAQLSAFLFALLLISRQSNIKKMALMLSIMGLLFFLSNKAVSTYADVDVFDLYFRRIASNIVGEDKVEGTVGDSFGVRAEMQHMAISTWKKVPVFGTGFGCLYYVPAEDGNRYILALEIYIYALATTGVLGGCCMTLFMMMLCAMSLRLFLRFQRRKEEVNTRTILVAMLPFLSVNQTVLGLSSDNLITPYHWVVIGVILAVYYHPEIQALSTRTKFHFSMPQSFLALHGFVRRSQHLSIESVRYDH